MKIPAVFTVIAIAIYSFFLMSCGINTASITNDKESATVTNPSSEVPTTTPTAPTSIDLVTPISSPSVITTPTFKVNGVLSGDTVKIYSNSTCGTEIGTGTSTSTSINITTSTLAVGTFQISSKISRAGIDSNCSSLASYTVISSATCATVSMASLGSITNSISSSMAGQSVYAVGNYAYMGTSGGINTGVQIVDITNPSSPSNLGYITTQTGLGQIDPSSNDILDIYVENDILYATTFSGGLLIADVSNKSSPVIKSVLNFSGETWSVAKKGNYVYVGSLTAGLYVVDVSNVNSPNLVNTLASMNLRHIQIVDDKIYGSSSVALQIISLAAPTAPTLLGSLTVNSFSAYETFYSSGYMYAIDKGAKNLLTYDVSNPASISLINTLAAGVNDLRSIIGIEDKIFIATGAGSAGEIRAYSISSKTAPQFLSAVALTHRGFEISFLNGKVFTSNGDGKLEVTQVCSQ